VIGVIGDMMWAWRECPGSLSSQAQQHPTRIQVSYTVSVHEKHTLWTHTLKYNRQAHANREQYEYSSAGPRLLFCAQAGGF